MADHPLALVDTHSDNSDESHNPFDDRVEQAQKGLMLAHLRRRYMNVWEYASRRWNASDIVTVLRNLERGFHIYSGGNNEQLQDISGAHLYLRKIFIQFDGHNWRSLLSEWTLCDEEGEFSENELKSIKERLQDDYKAISDYLNFFTEMSMIIYGREAQVIYDEGLLDRTTQLARQRYRAARTGEYISNLSTLSDLISSFRYAVKIEPPSVHTPDVYTIECLKLAALGVRRKYVVSRHRYNVIYAKDEKGYYVMHDEKTLRRVYLRLRRNDVPELFKHQSDPVSYCYRMQANLPIEMWQDHIVPYLIDKQTRSRFKRNCTIARELKKAERLLRDFNQGYVEYYSTSRRKHKILYDVYKNFMRDLDSKHEKMQAKTKARVAQIDSLLATIVRNPRSKLLLNRLI
jgi:hypothetical protein